MLQGFRARLAAKEGWGGNGKVGGIKQASRAVEHRMCSRGGVFARSNCCQEWYHLSESVGDQKVTARNYGEGGVGGPRRMARMVDAASARPDPQFIVEQGPRSTRLARCQEDLLKRCHGMKI